MKYTFLKNKYETTDERLNEKRIGKRNKNSVNAKSFLHISNSTEEKEWSMKRIESENDFSFGVTFLLFSFFLLDKSSSTERQK